MRINDTFLLLLITALPLKAYDVFKLFNIKRKHFRVWRTIGAELGVNVDTLNTIEKDNTDDDDRLIAVIDSAAPQREIMAKILESANISNAIAGTIMLLSVFPSPPPLKLD